MERRHDKAEEVCRMNIDLLVAISGLLILALGIVAFGIIILAPSKDKAKAHG